MKHSILLTILLILGACSTSPKNSDKQNALIELDKLKARLPKEVLINAKGYQATTITVGTTTTLTNTEKEHYFINDKYLSHVVTISLNGTGNPASGTEGTTDKKDKWNNDIITKAVGYVTLESTTIPGPVYDAAGTELFDTNNFIIYKATFKQHDVWTSLFIGGKDNWQIDEGSVIGNTHYVLIKMTDQQLKIVGVSDKPGSTDQYIINPKLYKDKYNKI